MALVYQANLKVDRTTCMHFLVIKSYRPFRMICFSWRDYIDHHFTQTANYIQSLRIIVSSLRYEWPTMGRRMDSRADSGQERILHRSRFEWQRRISSRDAGKGRVASALSCSATFYITGYSLINSNATIASIVRPALAGVWSVPTAPKCRHSRSGQYSKS